MAVERLDGMGWFAPVWRAIWRIALIVLLLWFLWHTRSIIITLLLSATLGYFVWFGVEFLVRHEWWGVPKTWMRFKRATACLLCYAVLGAFAWGASVQMSLPIREGITTLTHNWSNYMKILSDQTEEVQRFYHKNVPEQVREYISTSLGHVFEGWGAAAAGQGRRSQGGSPWLWLTYLVELILVPFIAFFVIVDGRALKREVLQLLPPHTVRPVLRVARETDLVMRQYILSQFILCLIAGVVTYLIFAIGLPRAHAYATIAGIYAGVTRVIPVVGSIIGGIPVILLAGLSQGSITDAVWVAVLFSTMHLAESKFLYPAIVGSRMAMHPVLVIVVLLVSFEFFGIVGMFFGPPVAAIARNVWLTSQARRRAGTKGVQAVGFAGV
ncbi:MAG: AI-2E family transporter [Fimbriimonadia bacterium]